MKIAVATLWTAYNLLYWWHPILILGVNLSRVPITAIVMIAGGGLGCTVAAVAIAGSPWAAPFASGVYGQVAAGVAYVLYQRFADSTDRVPIAREQPQLLLGFQAMSALSAAIAGAAMSLWLVIVPLVLWPAAGYLGTEIAIRRYMRRSGRDRGFAVFVLNSMQGRGSLLHNTSKYPYP